MQFISKCIGGSRMYGLKTPTSDHDLRGIFYNDTIDKIIGLNRYDHQDIKSETEDSFYWEIRHYLNSLRKTNTQAIELLYNENWIETSYFMDRLQENKEQLMDSERLYSSLVGYISGEIRLANGMRKGDIGKQRREAIEKYGFSPKNWTNIFRLTLSGIYFFTKGIYPTQFHKFFPTESQTLIYLKTKPDSFQVKNLNKRYLDLKQELDETYAKTNIKFSFNEALANDILLEIYGSVIIQKMSQI